MKFRNSNLFALALAGLLCGVIQARAATTYELRSPNNKIALQIRVGERIEYDLLLNQRPLLVGSDYKRLTSIVNNKTKLWIKLAGGGGWVARIRSQNQNR